MDDFGLEILDYRSLNCNNEVSMLVPRKSIETIASRIPKWAMIQQKCLTKNNRGEYGGLINKAYKSPKLGAG